MIEEKGSVEERSTTDTQFAAAPGGAVPPPDDPAAVQSELGAGRRLDGQTRGRMEANGLLP